MQVKTITAYDICGFYNPNAICKDCRLIFLDPMWTKESVSDFYEHHYVKVYKSSNYPATSIPNLIKYLTMYKA